MQMYIHLRKYSVAGFKSLSLISVASPLRTKKKTVLHIKASIFHDRIINKQTLLQL